MDVTVPTGTIGGADSAVRPVTGSNAISTPYIPGVTGSATADNPVATSTGVMQGPQPVSTISSSTAADHVTSTIAPTVANANKAISDHQTKLADAAAAKSIAPPQTQEQQDKAAGYWSIYGYDANGARLNNSTNNQKVTGDAGATNDFSSILDNPDTGHVFGYNPHDGSRVEVAILPGQSIAQSLAHYGLNAAPPTSAQSLQQTLQQAGGIAQAIPLDSGNPLGAQVARLSNGTYAALDASGNILSTISADQFNTEMNNSGAYIQNLRVQSSNEFQPLKDQMMNGTIPLAPWQQDQINNIQAKYADLVAQQKIINANILGGRKVSNMLTGQGSSLLDSQGNVLQIGVSEGNIQEAMQTGADKIKNLNIELAAAVSQMTHAFQSDNYSVLKSAYDEYQANLDKRQAEIDKMADRLQTEKDAQAKVDAAALAEKNKQQDQLTKDINDVMKSAAEAQAPKSVLDAISGAKTLGDALTAAGQYAASSKNSTVQEYIDYKRMAEAAGQKVLSFDEYQTKDANRKAQVAKAGATIMNAGIPSANITDPNASDPQLGGLSLNAVHTAAMNYVNTQKMPSLGLGQSASVQAARTAIMLEAGRIASGDATKQQQLYAANKKSLADISQREAFTNAATITATHNLDLALNQSSEVLRSGIPLVNKSAIIPWQGNIAAMPGLTSFEVYIYTAAREYAKVTSGGAASAQGLTDSAQREATKLINSTQTPEQFAAAVAAMKADMANVSSGYETEKEAINKMQANLDAGKPADAENPAYDMVKSQADDTSAVNRIGAANPSLQAAIDQMTKDGQSDSAIYAALQVMGYQ